MSKPRCSGCGDAQAPHIYLWTDALVQTVFSFFPVPQRIALHLFSPQTLSWILNTITHIPLTALQYLRIVAFQTSGSLHTSARTQSIWNEAQRRAYDIQNVTVFGRNTEVCRVRNTHARWEYFMSIPEIYSEIYTPNICIDDKVAFKTLLEHAQLPTPPGISRTRLHDAYRFFRTTRKPVVVKPRWGSRARHTTLDIRDENHLKAAVQKARRISPWYMVETFIPGDIYRATCVGGSLIGVVHFIRPIVTADGVRSADALRNIHNANKKHANMTDVRDDELFDECLRRQGFTRESIPPAGHRLTLTEHSERPNGGYFVDCTENIPDENRVIIEKAARACKSAVIGFDVVSRDLSLPHTTEPFSILEGNGAPFIELHDIPYEGTPRNVAAAVWDLWEQTHRLNQTDQHNKKEKAHPEREARHRAHEAVQKT